MQDWVLSNPAFSEEFFSDLKPVDHLPHGLRRSSTGCTGAIPTKFARYSSLALAIALVYDVPPPPYWPHYQVSPDSLPRKLPNPAEPFDRLTREDMLGRTYHRLTRAAGRGAQVRRRRGGARRGARTGPRRP